MRPESNAIAPAAPLLFRHAMSRIASVALPGRYDPTRQLWVIDTEAGTIPAIDAAEAKLLETHTATRERPESDDQDCSTMVGLTAIVVGGTTLTEVQMEADDQDASTELRHFDALAETHTMTKTQPEGDDTDITSDDTIVPRHRLGTLAELATKTDVQQESDDQMSAPGMLELETRTLNNQEGPDEGFPAMLLELQTKTFADVEGDDDDLSIH